MNQALTSIFDPTSPVLISLPVVFGVFKILFLIAFAIYIVYTFVIIRQIGLMSRTVTTLLESVLKSLAVIHLVLAIFIWILAFSAQV
jgi:hypothetical protein